MDLNLIVVIVFAALMILAVIRAIWRKRTTEEHSYQLRAPFLSPAERSFYGVLCKAAANDYVVLAKVRVADVITPKKGQNRSKWQTAFNRISSKHFDYALCNPNSLSVEHVVELQDRSHRRTTRAKRDHFLRGACQSAGLSLIEFAAKSTYSIDEVRSQIIGIQTAGGTGDGRLEPSL